MSSHLPSGLFQVRRLCGTLRGLELVMGLEIQYETAHETPVVEGMNP